MMPAQLHLDDRPARRQGFLDAMSQAAMSVSIVATDGQAGRDGVVVSAMSPVSADTPFPTLLISLHQAGRVPDKLLANGVFSVNLLAEDQQALADRFAGRGTMPREQWFAGDGWRRGETGAPTFVHALACFDCEVSQSSLVGTHHVIVGAVRAVHCRSTGRPLVHAQRRFQRLNIED